MIENPCDKCIVATMCEDPCEEMIEYLSTTLVPNHGPADPRLFPYIAKKLRRKEMTLIKGNKKLSFKDKYYE